MYPVCTRRARGLRPTRSENYQTNPFYPRLPSPITMGDPNAAWGHAAYNAWRSVRSENYQTNPIWESEIRTAEIRMTA